MIPITERLPDDKQKVLIDLGNYVDPAVYNAKENRFDRYSGNCHPGDRCMMYYYSGVIGWMPFPEPSIKKTFVAEPEPPVEHPILSTLTTFPNGELRGKDGWPTGESFGSIGL